MHAMNVLARARRVLPSSLSLAHLITTGSHELERRKILLRGIERCVPRHAASKNPSQESDWKPAFHVWVSTNQLLPTSLSGSNASYRCLF